MKKLFHINPSLSLIILAVLFVVGTVGIDHWNYNSFHGKQCVAALHTKNSEAPYRDYMLLASGEVDARNDGAWVRQGNIHGSIPERDIPTIFAPACSLAYSAESEGGPVLLVTTKRGTVYYSFNWGKDWEVQGDPELYREYGRRTK